MTKGSRSSKGRKEEGGKYVKKEDIPKLTHGSRYRIVSMMTRDEPLISEGVFKGYTMLGGLDSLCVEIDAREEPPEKKPSGKKGAKSSKKAEKLLRLIPCQMVIAIDILDQVEAKEEKDRTPDSRYYM